MSKENQSKKVPSDFLLIFCILSLLCIGVIMVFSASIYTSAVKYNGDQYFLFKKQLLFAGVGLIVMMVVSKINYKIYHRYHKIILAISILLLIAVLFVGQELNGARRWFSLGGLSLQPSEIAKYGVVIFCAATLSSMKDQVRSFRKGLLPYLILIGVVSGLIYKQPNLSTALIIAVIVIGMVFVAGGNLGYIMGLGGGLVGAALYAMLFIGWRKDRVESFFDPSANITGSGWQARQSLLALGSGGIFGQGLGNGKQKMFYLPEPQNDFIFAHIGEELGLIGTLLILALFLLLIWRGLRISLYAPDTFSSLLSFGVVLMVGLQVLINVCVVTQIIPVTGIPLPFISAGGSSLLFLMGGMGILLNISKSTPINRR
ncbi:putative lipid II flippase FtsW [Alkalibaculum sp. M08DMB]|uniref:Probable peptidoglycan glycosyltransferase FtsW n=1 Tax=Alkalibaculum sporogenes TaxID=2655001 RepID=A0A6A7K6V8_9FIRM|nr:putative lipid II flippase FtsW [Alkalibaculum sporogenes]MPW25180.1 putative lipid II flippase FtsW [Alkalibaculum sporogenes]